MHQKLLRYFNRIQPLTKDEEQAIAETIDIREYKKGSVLLKEGDVSLAAYFVLDGCVRQYCITDEGEKTTHFYLPEQWVTSIQSFRESSPSKHYLACSTDCTLVVGNREKETSLYSQFPRLESISRMVMEKVFADEQERLSAYVTGTPEQRYERLLQAKPDLLQLVPQYQIASYIGVQPESLSRIRKRLSNKK